MTLIDTGTETLTGGRLKCVVPHLEEQFYPTYGDGVADFDLTAEIAFHRRHGRAATVAAVTPPSRYGALDLTTSGSSPRPKFPPDPAAESSQACDFGSIVV